MTFKLRNYLLIALTLLFLLTRLYKITDIPPSVYWDEASIGYNAYSLAQTGKDEWGEFLPIHFRAFGEFKLPVYIYSVVPFVKIFGLNAFSVRIPAVLFSFGVVMLIYLLAKRISNNQIVALLASFFITVSPWFFIFSRTGYEATAGLMFYLLAICLFLKSRDDGKFVFFSIVSFILSIYSYNSFRIIAPLTILILMTLEIRHLKEIITKSLVWIILAAIILILSILPIYKLYVYDAGIVRFQTVGAESSLFTNYLSHFSLDFLLSEGDGNLRSQQSGFGQLYLPELIFILIGVFYIIGIGRKIKNYLLLLLLLLIGPLPASLTKESPHALRAISVVPFMAIISALGISVTGKYFRFKNIFVSVVTLIFLGFFLNYFLNFINEYPKQSSKDWQYGYKKIYTDFSKEFTKYDKVLISDQYAQPYMFALFYLRYDPEKFRSEVVRNSVDQWGFSTVAKFGKFEFSKMDQLLKNKDGKILIFTSEDKHIQDATLVTSIKFLDNSLAFNVYER